jgi:minor extracellular serine protease Vpr
LYFSQQEFNDFNAVNSTDLPTSPSDNSGISNVLIEKRGGTSNNGSGLPNTYTGTVSTINPTDTDVLWNTAQSRWEITFDVTGFSGFFLKTTSGNLKTDDFSDTKKAISFYPNPVKDVLNIESTTDITRTTIYNLVGQEIKQVVGNKTQIDISDLVSGIYIVKVTNDSKDQVFKICKK